MPRKRPILRCPICRTIVTAKDVDFPFCSERCRVIDLGKWASGAYKVSSPITDPDVLDQVEAEQARRRQDPTTRKPN